MLRGYVLTPEAVLNNFTVIGSLEFVAGESFTLVVEMYQPQRVDKLRFVAPATATMMFHLPLSDGSVHDQAGAVVDVLDRSLWKTDVTAVTSAMLMSGNFTFTLDLLGDGTKLVQGFVENGLSLVVTGLC